MLGSPGLAKADSQKCLTDRETANYLKIKEANELPNIWKRFSVFEVPTALQASRGDVLYLMNVSEANLQSIGAQYEPCEDHAGLFRVTVSIQFPAIQNTIYEYIFPNLSTHEVLSQISTSLGKPLLLLSIRPSPLLPEPLADFLARTYVHEAFHLAFQYSGSFILNLNEGNFPSHDILKPCQAHPDWLSFHELENSILKNIRKAGAEFSLDQLRSEVLRLMEIRDRSWSEAVQTQCMDLQSFWERIEGTAHYMDLKVGLAIHSFDAYPAFEGLDGEAHQFFYFQGATYALILDRLFPDVNWQARVEAGETPFAVLSDLMKTQGPQ